MRDEYNETLSEEHAEKMRQAEEAAEQILGRKLSDIEVLELAGSVLRQVYPAATANQS